MKHIVISSFIALFAISPICSQNGNDSEDLEKLKIELDGLQLENDKLTRELNAEKEKYETLKSIYEKLKNSYNKLKNDSDPKKLEKLQKELNNKKEELEKLKTKESELKQEKNNIKIALKDTVKVLNKAKNEVETAKKAVEDKLKNAEAILRKAENDLANEKKTTEDFKEQVCRLQGDSARLVTTLTENENLKKQLGELEAFKIEWLKELAWNVDNDWLCKKYSEIDLKQMEQAYERYKKYGTPDNPEVEDAKNKMTPFVENFRIYNEATEAINSPYDETLKNSLMPKLYALRDNEQDPDRKEELKVLTLQLGNYEYNVMSFEELMSDINIQINDLGDGATHKMAIRLVETVLKNYREDDTIDSIQEVPYLKKKLEEYIKKLREDCIKCSKEFKLELVK